MAIRYPRGNGEGIPLHGEPAEIPIGRGEVLRKGQDLAIIAFGTMVNQAMIAADMLDVAGIDCAVVNARFAKPLDEELIVDLACKIGRMLTIEENALNGGFGSAVAELLAAKGVMARLECLGIPDRFITHGTQELLRAGLDLDANGIVRRVRQSFPELVLDEIDQKMEKII